MLPVFTVCEETDGVSQPILHLHIGLCARGLCGRPIEAARLTEMSLLPCCQMLDVVPYDNPTLMMGGL